MGNLTLFKVALFNRSCHTSLLSRVPYPWSWLHMLDQVRLQPSTPCSFDQQKMLHFPFIMSLLPRELLYMLDQVRLEPKTPCSFDQKMLHFPFIMSPLLMELTTYSRLRRRQLSAVPRERLQQQTFPDVFPGGGFGFTERPEKTSDQISSLLLQPRLLLQEEVDCRRMDQ
ncbi:hypothetical protein AVEN_91421-1 [Araneus ventricosus]|uniref:Uncharacterized protein n=1 Tax=Araneus ventricosus TaxID=182803 RepID=A0A4Y2IHZ5_ARAVE|nr:hypothetical protein AVEN_91421-1 [Araneus ventricosus]